MSQTQELQPPQQQSPPGHESEMTPKPKSEGSYYRGSGKLQGKTALITGGDSGIGRSVAVFFAKEGADVAIVFKEEQNDADETKKMVEAEGKRCLTIKGDIGDEQFCQQAVQKTVSEFGHLDILINNVAEQHSQPSIEQISAEQLERTFRTNIFGMFFMTKAALPQLKEGSAIVNTTSVTAYQGNPQLLDYSSTKGAIVAFTRSLSKSLSEKGIRVNGVAPGPIWTPLIPSTFPEDKVKSFGAEVPMKCAGQPEEVAPCYTNLKNEGCRWGCGGFAPSQGWNPCTPSLICCVCYLNWYYVFLASNDSFYMSGQILHPNGGEVVSG